MFRFIGFNATLKAPRRGAPRGRVGVEFESRGVQG